MDKALNLLREKLKPIKYELVQPIKYKLVPKKLQHELRAFVLHEYEAVYFCIPKVASSTWNRVCATLLNFDIPETDNIIQDLPRIDKAGILKHNDYFKFAFVRNPFDRLVSCYFNKIIFYRDQLKKDPNWKNPTMRNGIFYGLAKFGIFKAGMSFEDFVRAVAKIPDAWADRHFISQYTFLTDESGTIFPDFIGKLENANKDFVYVLDKLGKTDILMPHFKKSFEKKSYREYYTPELIRIVQKRYSKDLEMFGYEF